MPRGPSRRAVLAVVVLVVLVGSAGCLGGSEECPPTITPVPYPDQPDELTRESVQSFAAGVERARVYRRLSASGGIVNLSFDPRADDVTRVDDGWTVRFETGYGPTACRNGALSDGTAGYTVEYFVNESVVYRAEPDDPKNTTNPREEGTPIRLDRSDNATSTVARSG